MDEVLTGSRQKTTELLLAAFKSETFRNMDVQNVRNSQLSKTV